MVPSSCLDVDRLLSAPTTLDFKGISINLDSVERAEWSLCESDAERDDYLQWVLENHGAHAASTHRDPDRGCNGRAGADTNDGVEGEVGQEDVEADTAGTRDRVEEEATG